MKRQLACLLAAAAVAALGSPALAQHAGHVTPAPAPTPAQDPHAGHVMPAPAPTPAAATDPHAGHVMPTPVPKPAPATDPHAGHTMPVAPPPTDPHAGHTMPAAPPATDPHAGHTMPVAPPPTDPHAGHVMPQSGTAGTDLPAGDAPPPPVPAEHAADTVYGAEAMAMGRHHLEHFHGGQKLYQVMANIAEAQIRNGRDGFEWDAEAWYGGDIDRLWLKSEGEGTFGEPLEKAELQALYSRAVDPYFNLRAGVRYDFRPDPSRIYATVGFEGLAPGFFDVEGALFVSNKGELMARAEGYYDQRITQRLILQPRAELNFAAQSTREIGVGAGLSDAEIGLRLRYDIAREFAPYVGVQYRRAFGDTRRYLREAGESSGGFSLLLGIRTWF